MDRISEKKDEYIVYIGNKTITYSKKRYGIYAKLLAKKSLKDKRRYEDYFVSHKKYTTFFIVTKKYGVQKIKVDSEDANIFFDKKISISKDLHAKTFYGKTKAGSVHRLIMNCPDGIVDHINRNGLDNRKENLRIVNISINNKNSNVRVDSPLKIKGVTKEITNNGYTKYISTYRDNKGKVIKHTFSANKYGHEKAFLMAVNDRLNAEEKYEYIKQECSETIDKILKQIRNDNNLS